MNNRRTVPAQGPLTLTYWMVEYYDKNSGGFNRDTAKHLTLDSAIGDRELAIANGTRARVVEIVLDVIEREIYVDWK